MDADKLRILLNQVRSGEVPVEAAVQSLRRPPCDDLGFANVDAHRTLRCGYPEVIFCEGKAVEDVVRIAERIVEHGGDLLATRASPETAEAVLRRFPEAHHHARARTVLLKRSHRPRPDGKILVISAGTSDIPVAEEARVTAEAMDNEVLTLFDVGVAGIHRLLLRSAMIQEANVLVVVAGMEGALASVVAGMVSRPVIAVPTSVGYGASFRGLAPLLTMLNSCAAGVAVVNIDNGFGAGYMAALINRSGEDRDRG
jgi:NCAIR mutase (PurE)-related protein